MPPPDVLPSIIDSPEAARTAVRSWAARADRISRIGELAIMLGRCHTEQHLRFLVDALAEYLGLKPESPEPSFPNVEGKEAGMVEPIPVDPETKEIPKPDSRRIDFRPRRPVVDPQKLEAPSVEAKFEEMATPMNLTSPFAKPKLPEIKARETPFTKIMKDSPLKFEEMQDEPAVTPPPEPEFPRLEAPSTQDDAPVKMTDTQRMRFEAPNRVNQEAAAAAETPAEAQEPTAPAPIPSLEPVLALDKAQLPQGVDPEILADIMRVEQCRRVFESTNQQIEMWEVFTLVMLEGDKTRAALEKLLALNAAGEHGAFTEGAMDLFQQLLALRARFGRFVRDVRRYVSTLPVGRFGKETIEMALGFLVVSARGRDAATRWLNEPKRNETEASNRWESLISTTMKYHTVLQGLKK